MAKKIIKAKAEEVEVKDNVATEKDLLAGKKDRGQVILKTTGERVINGQTYYDVVMESGSTRMIIKDN